MRTAATCSCGWRRELSEFYAGRRIRCPDCACIVEIPGEIKAGSVSPSADLYASRRIESSLRRAAAPASAWLPLVKWDTTSIQHPQQEAGPVERMPGWVWLLILAVLLAAFALSAGGLEDRRTHDAPRQKLVEPAVPESQPEPDPAPDSEQEDEF
jgi:hypothetical protein